jgi:Flp pilus assembly protein TadD
VGLLGGCADDQLLDPIRRERGTKLFELRSTPKAEAIVRLAKMTAARGDWPIAASLFRRATMLDGSNFDAIYGLAQSLNKLSANEEALEAFQQALSLRPKNADAMRGLGNTLVYLDRSALAIPHFERALAIKEDPRLFNGIAVAFDMLDDYKAAQAFYRVGLKSSPNNPSLRNNLALSLLLSGNALEAAKLLRELAGRPQATTRHRLNFALSLVLTGNTRMAESVVRMDLNTNAADDQIAYFETIKSLGNTKDARAAIRAHVRGTSNEYIHPRRQPLDKLPNRN